MLVFYDRELKNFSKHFLFTVGHVKEKYKTSWRNIWSGNPYQDHYLSFPLTFFWVSAWTQLSWQREHSVLSSSLFLSPSSSSSSCLKNRSSWLWIGSSCSPSCGPHEPSTRGNDEALEMLSIHRSSSFHLPHFLLCSPPSTPKASFVTPLGKSAFRLSLRNVGQKSGGIEIVLISLPLSPMDRIYKYLNLKEYLMFFLSSLCFSLSNFSSFSSLSLYLSFILT